MPIIENTHTARITAVDNTLFLPAERRGEGFNVKVIPSKTKLTDEQLAKCMENKPTRKLFEAGLLRVVEPKPDKPQGNQGGQGNKQQSR